jgi:thiol-disulfide isomerase/thioredoxin
VTGARGILRAIACALLATPAACSDAPRYTAYRAVLELPGGELPFGLVLERENGHPVAYLQNGKERVRIDEVSIDGSHLRLAMPGYSHELTATAHGDRLEGEAVMVRRGGKRIAIPFHARANEPWRFFRGTDPQPARVDGRWAVTLTDDAGHSGPAIAEFEQHGDAVTGTVLTPTGDHRFLAGEVQGQSLYLSRFDGGSAYLYHARLEPDGSLAGKFWSGTWSVEDFRAVRDEHATLKDPGAEAGLADPAGRFEFSFPDLDGKRVSLADARFKGKVVIVAIGGSWCPNCHDEAAFLVPYYERLHARGLEVVFLQFEYFDDFPEAVAANRRFVALYHIPWPVLVGGSSDREQAAQRLPSLGKLYGWPTTLFLDRQGQVRRIHTGFAGPATGAHYEAWHREFETLVDGLLAEPAS